MKKELQKRGVRAALILSVAVLAGITSVKAQEWKYDVATQQLSKGDVVLKNVKNERVAKGLVIGDNRDLALSKLDLTGEVEDDYCISEIGQEAFSGNEHLTSVEFPITLSHVGKRAFASASKLAEVNLGEDPRLVEIGEEAFSGTAITTFTFPGYITKLNAGMFSGCTRLTSFTIGSHVIEIGDRAFEGATALESIVFTRSLIQIGENAFKGCSSLRSVTAEAECSLTRIGNGAFRDCGKLTELVIPDQVSRIGQEAFARTGLTSVVIREAVAEIGKQAFDGCVSLGQISCYRQNSPQVDENAFSGGPQARTLSVPNAQSQNWDKAVWGASVIDYFEGWTYAPDARRLTRCDAVLENVTVREGSEKELVVGDNTNCYSPHLDLSKPVKDGYSLTEIGEKAFYDNRRLTSVVFPASLKSIGRESFKSGKLAEVTFPDDSRLEKIGEQAFFGSSVTTFTFPEKVTVIEPGTFASSFHLKSVTLSPNLTGIGESAFEKAILLESVEFPASLKSLGARAFFSCFNLASVKIPQASELSSVGEDAFNGCASLTGFTIPAGVTIIESGVFASCGLTSITLAVTVKEIGLAAFGNCKSLRMIRCERVTEPDIAGMAFMNGPEDRIVSAPNAANDSWNKEQWEAKEILYGAAGIGTATGSDVRVWVDGGVLQIASLQGEPVRIISADGISTDLGTISGNTQVVLPQGVSIVMVGDRKYKVVR